MNAPKQAKPVLRGQWPAEARQKESKPEVEVSCKPEDGVNPFCPVWVDRKTGCLTLRRDDRTWRYEDALATAERYWTELRALVIEVWDSRGKVVYHRARPTPRRRVLRKR